MLKVEPVFLGSSRRRLWIALAAAVALATAAQPAHAAEIGRAFDARVDLLRGADAPPQASQLAAAARLRAAVPELDASYDTATGVTRSLFNRVGYLTAPARGATAAEAALAFVGENLGLLGLGAADLDDYEVSDTVFSKVTGATHLYLRQRHGGIPVYNGLLQVTVNRDGRILSVHNAFVPDLAAAAAPAAPEISASAAVARAAAHLGAAPAKEPRVLREPDGLRQKTVVDAPGLSTKPVEAQLVWVPVRRGMARLAWNFLVHTPGGFHDYDFTVDAGDGRVWTRFDLVAEDSYRVYPQPVESPNHTTPLPPADARVLVTNPADAVASPFGWHDTNGAPGAEFTIHRGNNVHAYDDLDGNDLPPAVEPNCGVTLSCSFPLNLAGAPTTYTAAAITNLFYWNNLIHDVQYQYGFDEPAGNFQVNNYGHGGIGNDDVRAQAQDQSFFCPNNAFFSTPVDGQRPRMRMCLWTAPNPDRDGDLDPGVIVHEYGHGISNRLVGGPSVVTCLQNAQAPGEGLSDWWSLAYTGEVGDAGTDGRGIGTYVLNQPTNGPGIRTQRYSTDPGINTWTYASINGMAIPHGVGSVWAQGAWEVYWALVDHHGFDPDLYDALGGSGNQRMMLYVNEGLKATVCSPAFTDVRNGIIQAAVDNHGGEDVCRIWRAFAAFGLGSNAVSGGPNSTAPTNGFDIPNECQTLAPLATVIVKATSRSTNVPVVACPAGTKVIGGGCSDDFTSTRMRSGFPVTTPPFGFEGFACEHQINPGSLTVYAVCIADPGNVGLERVSLTQSSSFIHAICPAGKKVIGGGCRDNFSSTVLRASWPTQNPPYVNEGWVCDWQGNPGSLSGFATCINNNVIVGLELPLATIGPPGNVPQAVCSAGKEVIGGGCRDDFTSTALRSTWPTQSPPFVNEGWACVHEVNPGSLTAMALCRQP